MPATMENLRKDPAWRILNYKYEVFVPRFVTIDPGFIDRFGITVDEADNPNEELYRFVKVDRLIDFLQRGAIPRFKDRDKATELCNDIHELLMAWEQAIRESVDNPDPPLEYLTELEELYQALFKQSRIDRAQKILDGGTVASRFERYLFQRNANLKVGKQAAIAALPDQPQDAFSLVEAAAERRFGE